ncbi:MAG: hypothetical protein SFV15_19470 [Polyangiaceae bacterium]|nr:hypothetical protein [Polyangiaceae bacterium]
MSDSDFQLETHSQRVEVLLRNGRCLSGWMFLRPAAGRHLGAETIEDRLNESNSFFPLASELAQAPTREALLIAKACIVYVKAQKPTDDRSRSARASSSEVRVSLELTCDESITGMIYVALPQGRSRTLDWLNGQNTFLPVIVEKQIYYVNRDAICTAKDHNPSVTVPPLAAENS